MSNELVIYSERLDAQVDLFRKGKGEAYEGFRKMADALKSMKQYELYKDSGINTWEQFCRDVLGVSPRNAENIIADARVVSNLIATDPSQYGKNSLNSSQEILPSNREQIAPLRSLEPDEQLSVWKESVETAPNGKITGRHVRETAERLRYVDDPDFVEPEPEEFVDIGKEEIEEPEPENKMAIHFSSETPEHYTPDSIMNLVYQMFDVDLDPCSNSHDNPSVISRERFTSEDDGLSKEWHGKVYMNPPYGTVIKHWTSKLIEEYDSGRTTEAIALLPSRTDTQWFLPLYRFPICFVTGRITFVGSKDPAPFPSVIVYMGDSFDKFVSVFSSVGAVGILTSQKQ